MTEDPVSLAAIRDIARQAGLNEAVGILWRRPGEVELVVAIDNQSDEPQRSYRISTASLMEAIKLCSGVEDVNELSELDEADVVVWHTHPSGAVGPSLKDMRTKLPGLRYAVVVLLGGDGMTITEY